MKKRNLIKFGGWVVYAETVTIIINFYTCIYIHIWVCVTSSTLRTWRAVVDNIRWRIVGVMFLPSIFENRCGDFRRSMWRLSKIDVATFEDRCIAFRRYTIDVTMCRPSKIDVSTFGDRCVDLRRSMCRPSEIDVLTFEDRWSMVDVSAFEDRWSMWN